MADKQPLKVMISSTARDLPDHRKEVLHACLRQGMFPMMMEHLPASDAEAISASIEMVNRANIYLGVFAHRYGYIPTDGNPDQISITEMEYNRAVKRGIPRLIFVIDNDHPIKIGDVEQGEAAVKLKAFLERVKTGNIVNFFKSPEDLRAHAINSLSQHREADITQFHYVSDIPAAPKVYIAHPYTLLQTHSLIGRSEELELLTDWVADPQSEVYQANILSIVAIGGMGKSALTWKWFNDIASKEMKPLSGRMWWSFYESDATFENFVIRALAYVSRRPVRKIQPIPAYERESQLLTILNREPFLLVLDGLERLLIAYARMDANRIEDTGLGSQRNVRKAAEIRVGQFLRKLAQVKNSRILISSRLHPAELENDGGNSQPGTYRRNLGGLTDKDAIELWNSFGVTGSREVLLPIFNTFGKHPLLIQALAGEVKRYRKAPGNFEKWSGANPRFDPTKFPQLELAMTHVLEYALRGLSKNGQKVLQTIAAFRMPANYDTLSAVLLNKNSIFSRWKGKLARKKKSDSAEAKLDSELRELEDRGLVGWDKYANRYDLHPLIRRVVWRNLAASTRRKLSKTLSNHFDSFPKVENVFQITGLEDLTPAVELFNALIGLGHFTRAFLVLRADIFDGAFFRLSASQHQNQLLEMLFPDGMDHLPRLWASDLRADALNMLALGYQGDGQPGRSIPLFRRYRILASGWRGTKNLGIALLHLSQGLCHTGNLWESEVCARTAIIINRDGDSFIEKVREYIYSHKIFRSFLGTSRSSWTRLCGEGSSLTVLGLILSVRGMASESNSGLGRSITILKQQNQSSLLGVAYSFRAQRSIWFGEFREAKLFADTAGKLARLLQPERDVIRSIRLQGVTALGMNDVSKASERLQHALTRARAVNLIEEELPALIALAEWRRRQGDERGAREFLDDIWEYAERGPYPLLHADALNLLAQIERDAGNWDKAIEAATQAYQLSWCDGPPYAYHWGLIKARKHLEELGARLPEMPPFDESKYEPMPEVEINPMDEFHHETNRQEPDPTSKSTKKARGKRKKK